MAPRIAAGILALLVATPALADSVKPIACKTPAIEATSPEQTEAFPPSVLSRYKVQTIAWGLVHPFGLIFLPDGRFLVTERPGRIRIVTPDGALSAPLPGFPIKEGERLLDVIAAPDFVTSRLLYFNYAEQRPGMKGMSIVKARLSQDTTRLEDAAIIFRMRPERSTNAIAGRLLWGPEGKLFVTVSTSGDENEAFTIAADDPRLNDLSTPKLSLPAFADSQSLATDGGKVLRLNADGTIPADNPFPQVTNSLPEIFALGIRDAQGMAFDPAKGILWEIEHGPQGGDELNIINSGKNYGWPIVSYGCDYNGNIIGTGKAEREGLQSPIYFWRPSIAPSGLLLYSGSAFPDWKGNLLVGGLAGRRISRLVLENRKVVAEESLLEDEHSRIRSLYQASDGSVYVLTDEDAGRILRISPNTSVDTGKTK